MTETAAPPPSKRNFGLLIIGEVVALGLAATAMIVFDLGWLGAVMMAVLVAGFTLLIVRAGEHRAVSTGNFSPAMRRYNRRMLVASALYVVGLFGAIWVHDLLRPSGAMAFLIAFVPSLGVLAMIWAMGRLVAEESDEYLRYRLVRSALVGLGGLLTLATVWGFFEQFALVPHAPSWAAVPIFAIGFGLANCIRWDRP